MPKTRPPQEPSPEQLDPEKTEPVSGEEPEGNGNGHGKPARGKKRRGAQLEVKAHGDASEVREALADLSAQEEAAEVEKPEDETVDPEVDQVAKLLASPKCKAVVVRLLPREYKGYKTDVRVDAFRCPTTVDDIANEVFERHGGFRYLLSVYSNSSNSEFKAPLAAMTFEHPSLREPVVPEEPEVIKAVDPTLVPDDDPMAIVDSALRKQAKILNQQLGIKTAKKALRELSKDDDEDRPKPVPVVERIDASNEQRLKQLEEKFTRGKVDDAQERRIDRVEGLLLQMAQQPKSEGKSEMAAIMPMFLKMMESSDTKFQTMMTTMLPLMRPHKSEDGLDSSIEKLAKLKSVFGADDSRVKRIENVLLESALDRLSGGAESEDESDVKFAVKQLTPLAKTFMEKKLGEGGEKVPTQEELQNAIKAEAEKMTKQAIANLVKQGYIIAPQSQAALPAPKNDPTNPQNPGHPKKQEPKGEPEQRQEEGGDEVSQPISPGQTGYDRKASVNFVLDTLISDIRDGIDDEGSFFVGDCMDFLDPELLGQLMNISEGAQLEALLAPCADPEKIKFIKEAADKDPEVQSLVRQAIFSVQEEYRKKSKKSA